MEFEKRDVGKGAHSNHRHISGRSVLWKIEWKLRIWKLNLLKVVECHVPWLARTSLSGKKHQTKSSLTPRTSLGFEPVWKMPWTEGILAPTFMPPCPISPQVIQTASWRRGLLSHFLASHSNGVSGTEMIDQMK